MIERVTWPRLSSVALATAALCWSSGEAAAATITNFMTPITQNFDAFDGTVATVPSDFTFTSDAVTGVYRGLYNSDGTNVPAYNNNNGVYALYFGSSADRAFGTKRQPNTTEAILRWSIVNQTGTAISEFDVAWRVEQYSYGARPTAIDLFYDANGAGRTQAGISGTTLTTAETTASLGSGVASGQNLASPINTSRSVSIALATPLASGQSIDILWVTTGNTVGGANAHIGVDNLTVTAIPEPSTVWMGGTLAAIACSARRRLRRQGRGRD